ncbi:MAG: TlyA family RNA methyltransferase [Candidatus Omnitrophica bacterium]|nr:TlyA family RNA methyltransferase [Candidatus Omnitrophota bacterium]
MNEPKKRVRLDQLLVEKGMAESRTKAQALIQAGEVVVSDHRIDKPGHQVDPDSEIRLKHENQDVSRGAGKLRTALTHFKFSISGRVAADLGASTGGFTQVLLEQGAKEVHAFDVGYGLLHDRLRKDPRVIVHDRTNVRHLEGTEMPPADVVTMDLSFIGLELVLPAALRIASPECDFVALVKPQFEAGREAVGKGGIVRDKKTIRNVLEQHLAILGDYECTCFNLVPSEIKGKRGNQEFLSWFGRGSKEIEPFGIENLDQLIRSTFKS